MQPEPTDEEPDGDRDALSPPTDIIPPEIDTALRNAGVNTDDPDVKRAVQISVIMTTSTLPLPPAAVLAEYERVVPGLAKMLVESIKEQRLHRQALERAADRRLDRGQYIAASVIVLGLAGAGWLAFATSQVIVPVVIAILAVGGPTTATILARNSNWFQGTK